MQVADLKVMNQLKDMSLKTAREKTEYYRHKALKQTAKNNKIMAGVEKLEEKVMSLSKDLRPQYIAQKLEEVQRGRAEN